MPEKLTIIDRYKESMERIYTPEKLDAMNTKKMEMAMGGDLAAMKDIRQDLKQFHEVHNPPSPLVEVNNAVQNNVQINHEESDLFSLRKEIAFHLRRYNGCTIQELEIAVGRHDIDIFKAMDGDSRFLFDNVKREWNAISLTEEMARAKGAAKSSVSPSRGGSHQRLAAPIPAPAPCVTSAEDQSPPIMINLEDDETATHGEANGHAKKKGDGRKRAG